MPKTPTSLFEKILAISAEAKTIVKEKRPGVPYKTISHDDVTAMIKPLLLKYKVLAIPSKIVHTQNGNRTEVYMEVTISDDTDVDIVIPSLGYGVDSGDKGPGKAISYAFKYALLKAFLLETGDDPDIEPHRVHDSGNDQGNRNPNTGDKTNELPF